MLVGEKTPTKGFSQLCGYGRPDAFLVLHQMFGRTLELASSLSGGSFLDDGNTVTTPSPRGHHALTTLFGSFSGVEGVKIRIVFRKSL
jgi:hypothetical protein